MGLRAYGKAIAEIALAIMALSVALLMTACGGSGDAASATGATDTGTTGSAGASNAASTSNASTNSADSGASANSGQSSASEESSAQDGQAASEDGEPTGENFEQPAEIAETEEVPDSGGKPAITTDNVSDGYVTAQAESSSRLKFQVKNGDQTYNYDLPNDGTPEVFPINMGDGSYTFRIMQNTSGSNYVELLSETADVALSSEQDPYLLPNMFCKYDESSACVAKAREVTADAQNVGEAVQAICNYVVENITYDNAKAVQLSTSTGYVPDPDATLQEGSGICFDYAALASAMMRAMGIPSKIVTGYVGEEQLYHAWVMVYIDGSWQTALFKVDPNTWSRCDVTFASTGPNEYIGDASSYTDKYTY